MGKSKNTGEKVAGAVVEKTVEAVDGIDIKIEEKKASEAEERRTYLGNVKFIQRKVKKKGAEAMEKKFRNRQQFTIGDKKVTVYSSVDSNCPIVYLNTFADESDNVYQILQDNGCPDFTLVSIGKINWKRGIAGYSLAGLFIFFVR